MSIMRSIGRAGAPAAAIIAAAALAAQAGSLKIVEVSAPPINCVFHASCAIVVADSSSKVPLNFASGSPFLQSRTFTGAPGTPAAGLTGYEYRIDLTSAAGAVDCLLGLVVNFGPVETLPYKPNTPAQIYVVTQGGLGSIGVKSAEQDGDVIQFEFAKPLCVDNTPGHGASTYFFGLVSKHPPHKVAAGMWGFGTPAFISLDARAPSH